MRALPVQRLCLALLALVIATNAFGQSEARRKAALIAYHLEIHPDRNVAPRVALVLQRFIDEVAAEGVAPMILMDPPPLAGWLDRVEALQQARLTPALDWPAGFTEDPLSLYLTARFDHLEPDVAASSLNRELHQMLFASNVRGLGSVALQHLEPVALAHAPDLWFQTLAILGELPEFQSVLLAPIAPLLPLPIDATTAQWAEHETSPAAAETDFGLAQAVEMFSRLAQNLSAGEFDSKDASRSIARARATMFERQQPADLPALSVLGLAAAANGLSQGRYVNYLAAVQALGAALSLRWTIEDEATRAPMTALATALRQLATTAEPMLQIADLKLAQIHAETLGIIAGLLGETANLPALRLRQAASMAALQLVSGDFTRYLEQPFRAPFNSELDICFDQLEPRDETYPPVPITQEQFLGCARSLSDWATETAAESEFAGEAGGPFEPEHLARQLELDDWQRVNYWYAYTSAQYQTECTASDQSLVNPLEWALAARSLVMFADRWPAYSVQPEFRMVLAEIAGVGEALADALRRQIRCPESVLSPIAESLTLYEDQLSQVQSAARGLEAAFRELNLREGADIELAGGSNQETNYRPPELMVEPCRTEGSCGMNNQIEVSRALLGLYPASYLAADQVGLGTLTLCYDNIQWVDRRSELPRPAEKRMASFLGKLAFELYGKFDDEIIFARRLVSQTEYEYLFGENSEEVLNNACPRDLIGTKVESELPQRGINLVPRRLSYMTADRTHPSRVFSENWEQGEEWKDWFVTGRGVEALFDSDGSAIEGVVHSELQLLKRQLDQSLVNAMLGSPDDLSGADAELAGAVTQLDLVKHKLQALTRILATNSVVYQDQFRAILRGDQGLLDRGRVLSLNVDGLAPRQSLAWAEQMVGEARAVWQQQAELSSANPGAEVPLILARTLVELYALENRYSGGGADP